MTADGKVQDVRKDDPHPAGMDDRPGGKAALLVETSRGDDASGSRSKGRGFDPKQAAIEEGLIYIADRAEARRSMAPLASDASIVLETFFPVDRYAYVSVIGPPIPTPISVSAAA